MAKSKKRRPPLQPVFGPSMWKDLLVGALGALEVVVQQQQKTTTTVLWRAVLGFSSTDVVTKELVEKRYKVRAKILHPDAGGTENEMVLLNQARDAALKECL